MTRFTLNGLLVSAGLLMAASSAHATETREITVFKSPWCGCCEVWMEALQDAGYAVETRDLEDLSPVKRQVGVPDDLQSCHTAMLDGYAIEGHVPLQALDKLLAERPDVRGIATPGMPQGSLGMGYDEDARYTVYSFSADPEQQPRVFYEAGT
ncbi:DUF411 domain-containing protein [Lutibaculum baratangense]|uniref:CopG protein n=1 Tax=Lutibaculum baratangense AMV1 TaxID=631454 RepID=V4TCE0_9HYPH|nr:DUF411 domain-containing protein [Lutibaculum baratangense]ESR23983.1 CopG protein [Lutibaculum baratangense AMV1]